ncbi:hypothetical protein WBJ53_19660 [Spirosoma sp. SC4-14]|uniref:tetratricopeptide repeat protein n=1 Tax=Spirosoma sp. SC4-14 TaxID=3128900 RepID=UPI0030D5F499
MNKARPQTCFVICPIGGDDSDIRKNSDRLLKLVIEPAIETFDFKVIRIDKESGTSLITKEIIEYVQTSELCIIDLTNHNPNVFYECGRRHETGKPFIQLKSKDTTIPFDLKDIKTIDYDLSDADKIRETVLIIREFIKKAFESGFTPSTSGVSLSGVSETLERIERKIDRMNVQPNINSTKKPIKISGNAIEVFNNSLDNGDPETAFQVLVRLTNTHKDLDKVLAMSLPLIENYLDEKTIALDIDILENKLDKISIDTATIVVGTIVNFSTITDREEEYINQFEKIIESLISREGISDKQKAALLNQLQKLNYSIGDLKKAIKYGEEVIKLDPDEIAFRYNLMKDYFDYGNNNKAVKEADNIVGFYQTLSIEKYNRHHLSMAFEVYKKAGNDEGMESIRQLVAKLV